MDRYDDTHPDPFAHVERTESSLPFFFYGTLMKGEGNDRMLPDIERFRAYVDGYQLFYPSYTRSYPIARRIPNGHPAAGVVQGEVAWLDVLDPATQRMADMEIGAGYVMRPALTYVQVTPDADAPHVIGALIFEAPSDRTDFGPFIPTGNWRTR